MMGILLSYGLDLAGTEKRNSGVCVMNEKLRAKTYLLRTNSEIINDIKERRPDVVAIDAPLSIPNGRRSLEKREGPHLRACDRELLGMRIRFFPITLGPMRLLTVRGIELKRAIEDNGFVAIEVYPGAAQDILGIPRKQAGISRLMEGLRSLGLKGISRKASGDELDAATAAYVGILFLLGKAKGLGNPTEGLIYVPIGSARKQHK